MIIRLCKFKLPIYLAFLAVGLLLAPRATAAKSENNDPVVYDLYDVVLGPEELSGRMIAVKAVISCGDVKICVADLPSGQFIGIEMTGLTRKQRKDLLSQCNSNPCDQLLIGKVGGAGFILYGIDRIKPNLTGTKRVYERLDYNYEESYDDWVHARDYAN